MERLFQGLKRNKSLTDLVVDDLVANEHVFHFLNTVITEIGIKKLILNIVTIACSEHYPQQLFRSLEKNKNLEHLHMSGVGLAPSSLKSLAESLKTNDTLTTVSIRNSSFDAISLNALADTLKVNKTIYNLSIELHSSVSIEDVNYFVQALEMNRMILRVHIARQTWEQHQCKVAQKIDRVCIRNQISQALLIGMKTEEQIKKWIQNTYQIYDRETWPPTILEETRQSLFHRKTAAARTFANMVFFSDGYLTVKEGQEAIPAARVARIANQLILPDLQKVLSNRMWGLGGNHISISDTEDALRHTAARLGSVKKS